MPSKWFLYVRIWHDFRELIYRSSDERVLSIVARQEQQRLGKSFVIAVETRGKA